MTDKLTWDKWHAEARRAGEHYWCYAELVDDNPAAAEAAWEAGEDPYDYIKELGLDLDLHAFGKAWGGWGL
jgi:hypothetical protein